MTEHDLGFTQHLVGMRLKNLYKGFLMILENLEDEGCIDNSRFDELRKKVLDSGNDSIREANEQLEGYHKIYGGEE